MRVEHGFALAFAAVMASFLGMAWFSFSESAPPMATVMFVVLGVTCLPFILWSLEEVKT